MDNGHPVTRAELDQALAESRQVTRVELNEALSQQKDDIVAAMRDIETNLLTAFHSYAQGNAARLTGMEVTDHELRLRMSALETRVLNLETRRPTAS